jgi:uroporphyrin-III C-methyltransferase
MSVINQNNKSRCRVYLVGAGPGDPELITVKGYKALQRADVILFDRLVNIELIKGLSAEKIYVGKKKNIHFYTQGEINDLLINLAREGKTVVRLKGGDPLIFGRGGEEIEALVKNGIDFEIIPGLSSATAVTANIGFPLTHRELSSSIAIVTGHTKDGKGRATIPKADTLVFLMGLSALDEIVDALRKEGYGEDSKIAVISKGTLKGERYVSGTLADIVKVVEESRVSSPAVVIFGKVVGWYDELLKSKSKEGLVSIKSKRKIMSNIMFA